MEPLIRRLPRQGSRSPAYSPAHTRSIFQPKWSDVGGKREGAEPGDRASVQIKGWKNRMRGREREREEEIGRKEGRKGGRSVRSSLSTTRKSTELHFGRLEHPSSV